MKYLISFFFLKTLFIIVFLLLCSCVLQMKNLFFKHFNFLKKIFDFLKTLINLSDIFSDNLDLDYF